MDNDATRKDIPKWAWYTGSFLIIANRMGQENPETTKKLLDEFYKRHPEFPQNLFNPVNPGMIMMLLYGLLVVPKEIWDTRNDFPFLSRQHFNFTIGNPTMATGEFIRFLRNSISHANFSINYESLEYIFWNETKNGGRNFEISVSQNTIGDFLTELGYFYINYVNTLE